MSESSNLYIGLMSGTSLDSIDCALVDITESHIQVIDATQGEIPQDTRAEIEALNSLAENELHRSLKLSRQLAERFADCSLDLIRKNRLTPDDIIAIGCHGQTLRHQPLETPGFSCQIGDPNTLAEITGIDVVSDFRSRDIAAGGQGAPLVPLFHHALFYHPEKKRTVVNIGGMANVTHIGNAQPSSGFDSGPGNILMDALCREHCNQPFDDKGRWAAKGQVIPSLLDAMLKDPFFQLEPPKSTGRDYFNRQWLDRFKTEAFTPVDVMATLAELTATTITDTFRQDHEEIYVCGGGVHNAHLMSRIADHAGRKVQSVQALGMHPDYLEAAAFAWLAYRRIHKLPGNTPEATGAIGQRILGGIYAA